jgi:hypothetical protein
MQLREALDLCTDSHANDWLRMPGAQNGRPATAMLAGLFDPGMKQAQMRHLAGHSIAIYEPDARLSIVWPVPEDDDEVEGRDRQDRLPAWLEQDDHDWSSARPGWAVILLGGAPIWQTLIWYLNWGSGIGGYVTDFEPVNGSYDAASRPSMGVWATSKWAVDLAGLINSLGAPKEFSGFDPTSRLVLEPSRLHPVDAARPV